MILLLAAGVTGSASGEHDIRVLSYNTHGLPAWIAGDDPEMRFPLIGELANGFDLVLLQEDFRFHSLLRRSIRHPIVERGNANQRDYCPICSGAGLTTLASNPISLDASWNVPYDACSGWILAGNDCLASKGFQLTRVRIGDGAWLYVVNTHLDAGRDPSDRAARASQLATLRRTLEAQAAGAALILAGDLNLDRSEPADQELLEGFRRNLGLVDSGARGASGSGWVNLDYILFRSGAGALLEVTASGEDPAFRAGDRPLSDHPALFAEFRIRPVAVSGALQRVVEIPPSTGITAPVTYSPARDER